MSIYPYRWFAALLSALLVCAAGYLADLHIMMKERADLAASEDDVRMQLNLQREFFLSSLNKNNQMKDLHHGSKLMRELMGVLDENNMQVISFANVDFNQPDDSGAEYYQLTLGADYDALIAFLYQLAGYHGKYGIRNFVITANAGNHINMELLLRVVNVSVLTEPSLKAASQNISPFCSVDEAGLSRVIANNEVIKFPLESLRLIGGVTHQQRNDAVILFPDGVTEALSAGALLGSEGGKIIEIQAGAVIVQLPNKMRRSIIYSSR